jgi:predicted RNase H-like HicB family nuclease
MAFSIKIVMWQEDDTWFGYLQDYPDYWTQGKTEKILEAQLRDLYKDVTSGEIPGIRKVSELVIS